MKPSTGYVRKNLHLWSAQIQLTPAVLKKHVRSGHLSCSSPFTKKPTPPGSMPETDSAVEGDPPGEYVKERNSTCWLCMAHEIRIQSCAVPSPYPAWTISCWGMWPRYLKVFRAAEGGRGEKRVFFQYHPRSFF
jgi:hypothetical protein